MRSPTDIERASGRSRREVERGKRDGNELLQGFKVDVPEERQFVGFDAYKKAIDSGADLVILATPPGFRPHAFRGAR